MEDVGIVEKRGRYMYGDLAGGVSEDRGLDFHSPYGCSKGSADQYVRDYARIYGVKSVSFRQSCIYGTRQFGVEDQGWVAYFAICSVLGRPITIYGDGKQTRDVLYIDDLVDCYLRAIDNIDRIKGGIYNIGGGPGNVLSLLELISMLEQLLGGKVQYGFDDWRPGDQKTFVCNVNKAHKDFGWRPVIKAADGVKMLVDWVRENKEIF